jgi:hypothetical protein
LNCACTCARASNSSPRPGSIRSISDTATTSFELWMPSDCMWTSAQGASSQSPARNRCDFGGRR